MMARFLPDVSPVLVAVDPRKKDGKHGPSRLASLGLKPCSRRKAQPGRFLTPIPIARGSNYSRPIVADLNGDGKPACSGRTGLEFRWARVLFHLIAS
jgi:hypothetical protein